ncbi:MAG TPA: 50S ribosomal protein L18 [Chitinophagaceae bacterium]|nr:50S ribosomal protein L18 [Chitinophagaceae bacterium]
MAKTAHKTLRRKNIHKNIRKRISGTSTLPRLNVFRSNKEIYAQLIDDETGNTILAVNSRQKDLNEIEGSKSDVAFKIGQELGKRAKEIGIERAVFDRSGYIYHGRIKALAEGARESGLEF